MCSQRGLARLQLDFDIYTDTAQKLSDKIADLEYKHSRLKTINADTYDLAQEIRALGMDKARAEGKAMQIERTIKAGDRDDYNKRS